MVLKLYGNPYTGFVSQNRKMVENTLVNIDKQPPFKISHRVHLPDKTYIWLTGKGK